AKIRGQRHRGYDLCESHFFPDDRHLRDNTRTRTSWCSLTGPASVPARRASVRGTRVPAHSLVSATSSARSSYSSVTTKYWSAATENRPRSTVSTMHLSTAAIVFAHSR